MTITLKNDQIIAELGTLGGSIESLRDAVTGEEHSWPYDPSVWPRRTSICFPICSSVKGGSYTHQGVSYEIPMHGFLREMELQVVEQQEDRVVMRAESNDWTKTMYPFDFRFDLVQYLEGRKLVIEYCVTNTGAEPLPFSVGAHYPYLLPRPQAECCYLFTEGQHAGKLILENTIVMGKTTDVFKGADSLSMDHLFDHGSTIVEMEDMATDYIALGADNKEYTFVESEGFAYTVLWGKPDSSFACIESWAGMCDYDGHDGELLHKKGIHIAQPGETLSFVQKVGIR